MKGKRHAPEQIIVKLREADAMLGNGSSIEGGHEVVKERAYAVITRASRV